MTEIRNLIDELESYRHNIDDASLHEFDSKLSELRGAENISCELISELYNRFELALIARIFSDDNSFYQLLRDINMDCLRLFCCALSLREVKREDSQEHLIIIMKAIHTMKAVIEEYELSIIEEYPKAGEIKAVIEQYKAELIDQEKGQLH